jgi:hypothetical protein
MCVYMYVLSCMCVCIYKRATVNPQLINTEIFPSNLSAVDTKKDKLTETNVLSASILKTNQL